MTTDTSAERRWRILATVTRIAIWVVGLTGIVLGVGSISGRAHVPAATLVAVAAAIAFLAGARIAVDLRQEHAGETQR